MKLLSIFLQIPCQILMSVRVLHVWMAVHALMVLINIPAAVHLDMMEITVKIVSYMGMIWVSGADVIRHNLEILPITCSFKILENGWKFKEAQFHKQHVVCHIHLCKYMFSKRGVYILRNWYYIQTIFGLERKTNILQINIIHSNFE